MLSSAVMLGALVCALMTALLASQARPTFAGPGALRELTGLNVLGTVSMNWTTAEQHKLRRGQIAVGSTFAALLLVYGAVLASTLIGP